MIPFALQLLAAAVGAYAALAIVAHWVSGRLIFPRPPSSYDESPEVIRLAASDGVRIAARFWPADAPRRTVLWFHGNGEDLGTMAESMEGWRQRGFSILAIDYRGYGLSGGRPTEADTYADAFMALEWLCRDKRVRKADLLLAGYSLGSGPAVEIAVREDVAGLILFAPFVSTYRTMTRVPLFPGDKFENLRKIGRLRCPLLVMHGSDDRTVPCWHGERLFAAATVRKSWLRVDGAGHGDLEETAGEAYWRAVLAFEASLPTPVGTAERNPGGQDFPGHPSQPDP